MQSFVAKIYKLGINPVVDPPKSVLAGLFNAAGKDQGPIPVRGTVNGSEFVQTLVKFRGVWRLYVNGEMLKASGAKVGDTVRVEIEFDAKPREVPMPASLAEALLADPAAKIAFGNLPASRQKEIFRYLGSLKTESSIMRNVEKILPRTKRLDPSAGRKHTCKQKPLIFLRFSISK